MAYGMSYWIDQMSAGQSITQIAEQFYAAGVKYSNLTGFSSEMSNEDFINVIYRNVLGRSDGADAGGLAYWTSQLGDGADTRGSLVKDILFSAHSYKTNQEWHWVADLLDNKIEVGKTFAITWGLSYNTPEDSISQGMAIAAAVTSTDTATAIALIGVPADLYFG
jgi:serralysin